MPEPPYTTAPALGLDGSDISWIQIDFQTRLVFAQIKTEITIETPFTLVAQGREYSLDPEVRSDLGPLLAVYPATVKSANISSDLELHIRFTNGAAIEVPQNPHYEAWQVRGPGSRLIVCPPAGGSGLAVWE